MKKLILLVFVVTLALNSNAQSKESKWVLGVSVSGISFGNEGSKKVLDRYNFQLPKLNVTRYIFEGFSLEAGVTIPMFIDVDGFYGNAFEYWSLDGALRYDFNLSQENLVPYLAVGGSYIKAPTTIPNAVNSPTLNFSFGGTFWFHHNWGLNTQFTYKYSPDEIASMVSHSQISAGIVYSFSPRQLLFRVWE